MKKKKAKYSLISFLFLQSLHYQMQGGRKEEGYIKEEYKLRETIKELHIDPNFLISLVMVMLQFSPPIPAILTAKLPTLSLVRSCRKPPLRLSHTSPMGLFISNSLQPEYPISVFPPVGQSVAAIVFGDGSESRLYPLTKRRSEGAIPIAANYRLIDAVVSNCINSNITKIYALTQFNSTSLNSHLSRAYSGVGLGKEGFVEVIAAYQSPEDDGWFQGTAHAVRRCLWVLEEHPVTEFLVLPGHHLYRMDYQKLIKAHRNSNTAITVAASYATGNRDPCFGFLKVNSKNQVLEFREKPEWEPLNSTIENSTKSMDACTLGSMGIYVIRRDVMIKLLTEYFPKANEFASEVIPGAISMGMKVQSYIFDGYWEDMRNIEAFYQANMESTRKTTSGFKSVTLTTRKAESIMPMQHFVACFTSHIPTPTNTNSCFDNSFCDRDSPVYTLPRCLPPTLLMDAVITDCVIGDGCILNRCKIKGSVVGMRTCIGDSAVVEDSVVMGADIYQTDDIPRNGMKGNGVDIPIGIGEGSHIRKAIVDKNARIGKNVRILNKDNVQEGNREDCGYIISGGIVIVLRSAVIPDGSIL